MINDFHQKKRWAVVFACTTLLAAYLGLYGNTNGVFVKPICDDLGVERGPYTFYRTLILTLGTITLPFYNRILIRFGIRRVFLIGACGTTAAIIGYSFCTKLWQIYLFGLIQGIFYNCINFMSVGILINTLFPCKQGLALGIAYAGSGIGGALAIPVVSRTIEQRGWQWAYRYMAMVGLILMIVVILLFIREPSTGRDEHLVKMEKPKEILYVSHVWKQKDFWSLILAFTIIGTTSSATTTHLAPFMTDMGYSDFFASSIASAMLFGAMAGKLLLGEVYDRLGVYIGNFLVTAVGLGGLVAMFFCRLPIIPWVCGILSGAFQGAMSVPIPILSHRYFNHQEFPYVFSIVSTFTAAGASIAVSLVGFIYDVMGSYFPAWGMLFLLCVIMAVLLFMTERIYRKNHRFY